MNLLNEGFEVLCRRLRILRYDKEANCYLTRVNTTPSRESSTRLVIPSHALSFDFYTRYCPVASIHILLCDVHRGVEVLELDVGVQFCSFNGTLLSKPDLISAYIV